MIAFLLSYWVTGGIAAAQTLVEYKAQAYPDPFEVMEEPEEKAPVKVEEPEFSYKLDGLLWTGGKAEKAIVSGQIVTVGSRVGQAEVLSIDPRGVRMRQNDREYFLAVKRGEGDE